jgi:uncharacterized protein YndB with AHSA1/START domain
MKTSTVVVKHTYNASQEKIFNLWTTPEGMTLFMDAGNSGGGPVNVKEAKIDLRVGGKFSLLMSGTLPHHGEYKEIKPFSKIVFTWNSKVSDNTLVTIEFKPIGDKTECILTHELLEEKWAQAHHGGWTQILNNLANV